MSEQTVIALVISLLVAGVLYFESKKKKLELGVLIQHYLAFYSVSITMALVLLIAVTEGGWAGSIVPEGEIPVNPVFRTIGHVTLQLFSVMCAIVFVRDWKTFFKTFLDIRKDWPGVINKILFRFASLFIMGYGALYIPWWNLMLIANGLNEIEQLELYWASMIPYPLGYSTAEYMVLLASKGLPRDYNAFQEMSYSMAASTVLYHVHIVLILLEGLWSNDTLKTPKPAAQQQPTSGGTPPGGTPPNNNNNSVLMNHVKDILKFYGLDDDEIDNRITQANATLRNKSAAELVAILQPFAALVGKVKEVTQLPDGPEKDTKAKDLRNDIKDKFAASPRNNGLGISLPAPKN